MSFLARMLTPPLAWLQVEITSHCNAACRYCPHTVYAQQWQAQHLPMEIFQQLVPAFRRTALVYLQGWGEPFLHPDFLSMVALAKSRGGQVGTTTNATRLDAATIRAVVASGLDVLTFSLTGLGVRHDYWRTGTSFDQVLKAIKGVQQEKRRQGRDTPQLHVAYLLLRSGLPDLADLPKALSGLGINQVVISTLDFVAAPHFGHEAWKLAGPQEIQELQRRLADLVAVGARQGLSIHPPAFNPVQPPVCPENILRAAVIAATGHVAPCVFRNIPAPNCVMYIHQAAYHISPCHFGHLQHQPFWAIWQSPAYRAFRRAWRQGQIPEDCRACLRIRPS